MAKERRDTTTAGDLLKDVDGAIYVLLNTKLGFIAVELTTGNSYGGLHRLKSTALDGLDPLGFRLDLKYGKKWEA